MTDQDGRDQRNERGGLSRRDFLTATAAGVAVGGLATLPSPAEAATPDAWDVETDVIVAGSGTGLVGAIAAARAGAEVIVLEKQAGVGGNTAMSGGVVWIPNNHAMKAAGIEDSRETALTYVRKLRLEQADDELLEAFVDNGPRMARFVEDNTDFTWRVSTVMGKAADYHPDWEGGIRIGRSIEPAIGEGGGMYGTHLISSLMRAATEAGADVRLETPARRLITREQPDGRREVIGVLAEHDGKPVRIRARRAVHLAAGGFDWDFTMKAHFLRGMSPYPLGSPGNTGDGVRMAMQIGADLRNMNEAWGITVYKGEAEAARSRGIGPSFGAEVEKRSAGSIVVNRYGERFSNETADYDSTWRSYFSWENHGDLEQRNLPAFAIYDSKVRNSGSIAGKKAGEPLPDWVIERGSLAEIARHFGIDEKGLAATVAEFNKHAREGRDPRFERAQSSYDRFGFDDKSLVLGPVEQPPFYAAEVAVGDLGTCGGPRVDGTARVIDPFGDPIERLYASGNNAGIGSPGASYGGGGGTIGPAMTFAYIAGRGAAALPPWT